MRLIETKLFDAFSAYLTAFQNILAVLQKGGEKQRYLYSVVSKDRQLRSVVNKAEQQSEFQELVKATESHFAKYDEWRNWKSDIQNFFCNSNCYIDLFEGKKLDINQLFNCYCKEFQRQDHQIKLLAVIEFVNFAEELMDFGSFGIRRFSAEELGRILRNEINRIFYPKAYIDATELKKLERYWLIYLSAPKSEVRPSRKVIPSGFPTPVERKYTEYPKALESVLKCLILFEWKQTPKGWMASSPGFTFNIPLILEANESLLTSPMSAPEIPFLETTLVGDQHEEFEIPAVRFYLKAPETAQFKKFITNVKNILDNLKIAENEWRFLEIAQGYFVKAFFTGGLEQLLWHITVIEALLGERGEDITEHLAKRIATILGSTKKERKKFRDNFKKLYELRSALVHGGVLKKTDTRHLYYARNLARQTLLWFLHYLHTIQSGIPQNKSNEDVPTRKDMLTLIDLNKNSRVRMRWIMGRIPEEFPNIPEWIE